MSNRMIRICYLANAASVHTRKWAAHFVRRGYDVHIASLHPPGEEMPGVTVHYLGANGQKSPAVPGWRYALSANRARALVHHLSPQILHAHYATGYGLVGSLVGFHPYIVSVWGSDLLKVPRQSPLHRALLKFNLGRADYVCSTSRYMALDVRKYTSSAVVLTPFGVDCDQFNGRQGAEHQEGAMTIGTVRPLEEGYGVDILIQAFALLVRRDLPKLRLLIVGDGAEAEHLRRLARTLNIAHLVEFAGWVPHRRVPEYLQRLSVFVAPSVHEESFGVAVLEASACGVPVVASHVGGLPEVVEDDLTGLLVPPGDESALASAVEMLVRSGELRRRLGEAGREFVVRTYAWDITAQTLEDLYARVLSASVPRPA